MSNNSKADSDRFEELEVARLLFGLTRDEQAEHEELAQKLPAKDARPLDEVVASLDQAWLDPQSMSLPEHLRQAIRAQAEQQLSARQAATVVQPAQRASAGKASFLPWLITAACLLFAVSTWIFNRPTEPAVRSVAQQRADLIASASDSASDIVQADWSPGTTPIEGVSGDVVWSSQQQQGYLRFVGLPVNTPSVEQYQLWIFDKNQSDKTPIDGGVFDIRSSSEVVVPINAKLEVQNAFMFAITIEKPGGVVVSSRERLPLLAKVE